MKIYNVMILVIKARGIITETPNRFIKNITVHKTSGVLFRAYQNEQNKFSELRCK